MQIFLLVFRRWLLVGLAACLVVPTASAKRSPSKRRRRGRTSSAHDKAIFKLLAPFKWGQSPQQVMQGLEKKIRSDYTAQLQEASRDAVTYDRIRKEMLAAVAKMKKSFIRFSGKPTPWDRSLIDAEFVHNNSESLLVRWGERERRFYFFFEEKLWKVFVAFDTSRFRDKSFKDFASAMEARFGPAERKFRVSPAGKAEMAYLNWPPTRRSLLRAVDNTGLYGSFCLVLIHQQRLAELKKWRKINNPQREKRDRLLETVTANTEPAADDANENVVDEITGKPVRKIGSGNRRAAEGGK